MTHFSNPQKLHVDTLLSLPYLSARKNESILARARSQYASETMTPSCIAWYTFCSSFSSSLHPGQFHLKDGNASESVRKQPCFWRFTPQCWVDSSPQFYEVSSFSTSEFAKPPVAVKVDTEASKMAIYWFTRRQWLPGTMACLLIVIQGNQALVDPMDSDQKFTYFKLLVELVRSTHLETPVSFK